MSTINDNLLHKLNGFFSDRPGSHERHLQRRLGNPLFPQDDNVIDEQAIKHAQQKDRQEELTFEKAMRDILQHVSTLPAQIESDDMHALREQLDRLYEQACGLGGDYEKEKQGLLRLYELIMKNITEHAGDDQYALQQLQQTAAARAQHLNLLQCPLVADLLRPDSPIAHNELVPTLLGLDKTELETVITMFDAEQHHILFEQATQLLSTLKQHKEEMKNAWENLVLLDQTSPSRH